MSNKNVNNNKATSSSNNNNNGSSRSNNSSAPSVLSSIDEELRAQRAIMVALSGLSRKSSQRVLARVCIDYGMNLQAKPSPLGHYMAHGTSISSSDNASQKSGVRQNRRVDENPPEERKRRDIAPAKRSAAKEDRRSEVNKSSLVSAKLREIESLQKELRAQKDAGSVTDPELPKRITAAIAERKALKAAFFLEHPQKEDKSSSDSQGTNQENASTPKGGEEGGAREDSPIGEPSQTTGKGKGPAAETDVSVAGSSTTPS